MKKDGRLVIVGGVAAGASAAAKARRMSESMEIVLLEAGPFISFANCGLPYYVGKEIVKRESLFVTNAEALGQRFNLLVRTGTMATAIDPENRTVTVASHGREETLAYDRLVLATGTVPVKPPIPGLDCANIFTVRTVPDVDAIVGWLAKAGAADVNPAELRALVMGGGFIGLETAEQLLHLGLKVTLVEKAPQLMIAMDPEIAVPIRTAMECSGVQTLVGDGVAQVRTVNGLTVAVTESGQEIPFDLGILSLGVRPNVALAKAAGILLGTTGAIAVDQFQRTSIPGIYAAGDNCEAPHIVLNQPVNIPLAGPANKMGRIAGANAALDLIGAGEDDPRRMRFAGVLGSAVVRVCGHYAAVTGLTEKAARSNGIPCQPVYMFGASNAGYYPGSEQVIMKVLAHPETGRLLGAQAVGGEGAEKRVDVLAAAITGGLTLEDLEQLDLCYAPPVSSAKDLPIMIGFAGSNIRRDIMPAITASELLAAIENENPYLILDVRTVREFVEGHLPGAVNIPVDELRNRLGEVPRDCPIAVHCRSGYRSYIAQRILLNHGWTDVRNVQGGFLMVELCRASRVSKPGR